MAPKPKPASSQPTPPPSVEDLFTTLNKHINASAFQNAVKLSDQILAISSSDEDAIRCKIVALIKDDRIDEALSAIRSSPKSLDDFGFLKAYCLYRQNKLDEALDALKG
ncbi:putative tetratricopeptide-like helical domain, signal recognition particle, SRP72 subunit [Lupinus albus]|uniref:Putative tetratricopeptide-like helical domain, signal recognition particle, SRP72 subunit n=1 Tax=Lupinus albus TaxID=3870 RepID=A0A6A4PNL7_LUPAL|nr:putative tetratricopeptide-like helical domain, signal recognition particle, SRP72 subunit [Lupinus albus]